MREPNRSSTCPHHRSQVCPELMAISPDFTGSVSRRSLDGSETENCLGVRLKCAGLRFQHLFRVQRAQPHEHVGPCVAAFRTDAKPAHEGQIANQAHLTGRNHAVSAWKWTVPRYRRSAFLVASGRKKCPQAKRMVMQPSKKSPAQLSRLIFPEGRRSTGEFSKPRGEFPGSSSSRTHAQKQCGRDRSHHGILKSGNQVGLFNLGSS